MFLSFLSIWLFYIVQVVSTSPGCFCSFNPHPLSLQTRQMPDVVFRSISTRDVQEAWARARDTISKIQVYKVALQRSIPVARHQHFQAGFARSKMLENNQKIFEETTKVLLEMHKLTTEQILFELPRTNLKSIVPSNEVDTCEAQFNVNFCSPMYRYRTMDGTCNNLRNPSWGMAGSCFERLLDPDYADGFSERRVAMSGNPLPSSRRISLEIHNDYDDPSHYVTHMFMQWGQFLDHDITLTPQTPGPSDQEPLECCPVDDENSPACDPVILPRDDPFFRNFNITCLTNVRSAVCSTCTLGPRQQINRLSAYIDASQVYGTNENQSRALRNNDGTGTLRFRIFPDGGELPPSNSLEEDDFCSFQNPNLGCFETGDQRANEQPALTAFHILFMREHNRIARRLRQINPRWTEDTLFEEARRIVGAEMQVITYKEFLPMVLGLERMEWFNLFIRRNGQFTEYDGTLSATLLNEFSTAAFRFGHTIINSFFQDSRDSNQGVYLRDTYNFPFGLYTGQLEGIVGGLAMSPSQKFDRYMVRDIMNHLYQNRGNETGLDLTAITIQRGRDHGIPGYTAYVEFCGGPKIRNWRDLDSIFQMGLRERFQSIYERVEDIDLVSGGMVERPNPGAVVGPTFTCIIGIQFYHLKYGDRFYFEHGGQAGSFTPYQLEELKKVTFGRIICDNSRIDRITKNVFHYPSTENAVELCNTKEEINLEAWRV